MDRSDFILKLCNSLIKEIYREDGSLEISFGDIEKFRLRNNGISFPELTFNEIHASCVGLSNVLIHKGQNVIIDHDHQFFWAWIAQIAVERFNGYFSSSEDWEIRELCMDTFRLVSAGYINTTDRQKNDNYGIIEHLICRSHQIVAYLSFPLLEATLRKSCNKYVDLDGRVLKEFKVPKQASSGSTKTYKKDSRCSNICHMLFLLYQDVAEEELRNDIDVIRKKISEIDEKERDGFDVIWDWRNSSLHGETSPKTIGGTVLNLICIIIIHALKDSYQGVRNYACAKIESSRGWPRHPESFYPPI